MLGETAEFTPEEHRNNPCSHADLAGCGGETEWDILDESCGELIGKEGEGVSVCCLLCSGREGPTVAAAAGYVADG